MSSTGGASWAAATAESPSGSGSGVPSRKAEGEGGTEGMSVASVMQHEGRLTFENFFRRLADVLVPTRQICKAISR